jgi:hypothetical protein
MRLKEYDEKKFLFEQMGTMLNLLTTVLTKLKWLNSYSLPLEH